MCLYQSLVFKEVVHQKYFGLAAFFSFSFFFFLFLFDFSTFSIHFNISQNIR